MKKLDCGLFALQLIVYTVLELCANGSDTVHNFLLLVTTLFYVDLLFFIDIFKISRRKAES